MIVRLLGLIDLIAGVTFLLMTFQVTTFVTLTLFSAGLLFLKSLFIFSGEPLSLIDLVSSISLLISLLFPLPAFLLWLCMFLLIAKGVVSFI